jgi:hypothetical protein
VVEFKCMRNGTHTVITERRIYPEIRGG